MQKHKQWVRHNSHAHAQAGVGGKERKFQREQVGVVIAIYQEDFDLLFTSVTAAEMAWMDPNRLSRRSERARAHPDVKTAACTITV